MLARLIRMEFIFNKRLLVFSTVMVLAVSIVYPLLIDEVSVSFVLGVVYLGFIPISLIARASKFQVDSSVCALPVSRRQVVLGRYLFIAIVAALLFLVFLCALVAVPYEGFNFRNVLRLDRLVNAIAAIIMLASLIIPLVLRFGYTGVIYFLLGINLLTVVLFIFTATGGIANALDFVFRELPRAVRSLRENLGTPGYHLTVLASGGLVALLSFGASVRLYSKKEF